MLLKGLEVLDGDNERVLCVWECICELFNECRVDHAVARGGSASYFNVRCRLSVCLASAGNKDTGRTHP